jgi:hypothetical protein
MLTQVDLLVGIRIDSTVIVLVMGYMIDNGGIEGNSWHHVFSDVFLHYSAVLEMAILVMKLIFDGLSSELFKNARIILLFFTVELVGDELRNFDALFAKREILGGHLVITTIFLNLSFADVHTAGI